MPQYELAQAGTEQKAKASEDSLREQIIAFLPRLSAFAHFLTGNAEQCDDLVQETCAYALAHKDQWQPGMRLHNWMFRVAHNLWSERVDSFSSEPVDVAVAESLASSDAWAVRESEIEFADLLTALDQLSLEHRTLIALVCVGGLTYSEAAEIVSLPVATVMSKLARGRLALHGAVDEVTASRATRH